MYLMSLRNTTWPKPTTSTLLWNKEAIKAVDVANGVTIAHSKQRLICFIDTHTYVS